jgi:RNA polymerase sigma-70 factor (ECF subfamily)
MTQTISSEPYGAAPNNIWGDSQIMAIREQMIKFATLQLKDPHLAEDAVQEALISAFQHIEKFQRQAAFKTWVFAILKNKIIDLLRKQSRFANASDLEDGHGLSGDALLEKLFDSKGHWVKSEKPIIWQTPDEELESDHFWQVFEACLNGMPEKYSRLFMMREFLELDSQEICENEQLTSNTLNVTLYRARIRLRECLENQWFKEECSSC